MKSLIVLLLLTYSTYEQNWHEQVKSEVLNDSNFQQKVGKQQIYVIDYFTPWCTYCRQMAGEWSRLYEYYEQNPNSNIIIAKVNCDENQRLCQEQHVHQYPTIKLYPVQSNIGKYQFQSIRDLQDLILWIEHCLKHEYGTVTPSDEMQMRQQQELALIKQREEKKILQELLLEQQQKEEQRQQELEKERKGKEQEAKDQELRMEIERQKQRENELQQKLLDIERQEKELNESISISAKNENLDADLTNQENIDKTIEFIDERLKDFASKGVDTVDRNQNSYKQKLAQMEHQSEQLTKKTEQNYSIQIQDLKTKLQLIITQNQQLQGSVSLQSTQKQLIEEKIEFVFKEIQVLNKKLELFQTQIDESVNNLYKETLELHLKQIEVNNENKELIMEEIKQRQNRRPKNQVFNEIGLIVFVTGSMFGFVLNLIYLRCNRKSNNVLPK